MDNSSSLSVEKLNQLMDSMIPEFNSPDIDDFIAKGTKIEDMMFVTCLEQMRNVPKLRTKHGILNVHYSKFLPKHANYLMRAPKSLLSPYRPFDFELFKKEE